MAAISPRSATVTTADGKSGAQVFTINVSPRLLTVSGISPASDLTGSSANVIVTGTNFVAGGTTVAVSDSGIAVGTVTVTSPTSFNPVLARTRD